MVDNVSQSSCDGRHKRVWQIVGLLIGLMGLFCAVAAYSVRAGLGASGGTTEVRGELRTHVEVQAEQFKGIEKSFLGIEKTLIRIETRQTTDHELIEELLQRKRGP